ncbi:hypothetical protein OUZ56_027066 [Daphnia magna]|uniref:Uncharacterized protein n=1 Tax=Daphnia magna TaxID=35525 RepID=A0ABQ9ZPZ3_9CRUS|nr:hypothetical protein OUZ56_027066 [Daphnia magna]
MERYGVEIVSGLRQCLSWTNERFICNLVMKKLQTGSYSERKNVMRMCFKRRDRNETAGDKMKRRSAVPAGALFVRCFKWTRAKHSTALSSL